MQSIQGRAGPQGYPALNPYSNLWQRVFHPCWRLPT